MTWHGRRSTAHGTTTAMLGKAVEPSKSTLVQVKSEKERRPKLQHDLPRKKPKKKPSKLNGSVSPPTLPNSIGCVEMPMQPFTPPWKQPVTTNTLVAFGGENSVAAPSGNDQDAGEQIQIRPLVNKAIDGDRQALDQVRELMADHPEIWRQYGDAGMLGLLNVVQKMSGANAFSQEVLWRHADALWHELAGDQPTGLLKVCIQGVIAAALEMAYMNMYFPVPDEKWTIQQHALLLKRRDSAQRRLAPRSRRTRWSRSICHRRSRP